MKCGSCHGTGWVDDKNWQPEFAGQHRDRSAGGYLICGACGGSGLADEGVGVQVEGYCPMGCGRTLILGNGNYVTCSWGKCPNPGAASDILATSEIEHVVRLGEESFDLQHPLRERLNGDLFTCPVHRRISELDGPPSKPGLYRVIELSGRLVWQRLTVE